MWILRFPATDQLFHGKVTDSSIAVTETGATSCHVSITVPQNPPGVASFDLPETSAAVLSAELAIRKEVHDAAIHERLSPDEVKSILKTTRQPQQDVATDQTRNSSKTARDLAYTLLFLLLVGLAVGIPLATQHTSNSSQNGSSSSSAAGSSSGTADNCQAGYGYLDVDTNECYQGSGPNANNSAGNGAVANCPAGYPYYNAGTDKCYTAVPGVGGTSGGSVSVGGGGSGGATSGGPASCGLEVNQTYTNPDGATVHVEQPTNGCYIHITESDSYNDLPSPAPPCSSSLGSPPSTISNIVSWEYSYAEESGATYEAYILELENHTSITISGCHFNSYGMTELNHLTNYNYIG
jgi:hypothetical protein